MTAGPNDLVFRRTRGTANSVQRAERKGRATPHSGGLGWRSAVLSLGASGRGLRVVASVYRHLPKARREPRVGARFPSGRESPT
jgi:hypothetical protein